MEFISQFLEMLLAERVLSKNSILSYKRDLFDFQNYLAKQRLSELNITTENVRDWIEYLASNDLQARSINRKISTIKSYYEFLISENHTAFNPVLNVDLPKYQNFRIGAVSDFKSTNKNFGSDRIRIFKDQKFSDRSGFGVHFF